MKKTTIYSYIYIRFALCECFNIRDDLKRDKNIFMFIGSRLSCYAVQIEMKIIQKEM